MRSTVVVLLLLVIGTRPFSAQAPAPAPAFEVASVKPSNPDAAGPLGAMPMILPPVGGRFSATNVPLRAFVRLAYGLQDFQIVGGPSWQMSQKFDIVAKAESASPTMQDVLPMLKALLAERFKLRVHTETREMPIYALVLARSDKKLGPDIKPSTADCSQAQELQKKLAEALAKGGPAAAAALLPRPGETVACSMMPSMGGAGGFGLRANGQSLEVLVQLLTQATGRVVKDETGLTGLFDWEMKLDPEVLARMAAQSGINVPINLPPSDSPSLLTALQEQLGLKLDSRRGPVDVLVIDSAEQPTPD